MIVAWILAGLATILWIVLLVAKFFRVFSTQPAPGNAATPQGKRAALESLPTNPEVWRKRLRSYIDTRYPVKA